MSSNIKNGRGSSGAKLVDEAHMKTIRELCQLPGNKHCFECAQRGPTYVDVTIGSFICMTCSGLLRGITPPHRVKSISMATFTPEEIQLLKSRGNEYCRKVWLATYTARDSNLSSEPESDRRNTLKTLMSAKYEQKRYYVDPSKIPELCEIAAQNAKALLTSSSSGGSSSSVSNRSPSLSSASSGGSLSQAHHSNANSNANANPNAPSPILNNLRNSSNSSTSTSTSNRLVSSQTMPDIKPLTSLLHSGSNQPFNFINNLSSSHQVQDDKIINTNPPKDPWGNSDMTVNGFNANFANFDEAFSSSGNNGNFDPFSNSNSNANKSYMNQDGNGSFGGGSAGFATFDKPLLPQNGVRGGGGGEINNDLNGHGYRHQHGGSVGGRGGAGDRYAALKDLDELFKNGSDSDVVANNTNPPANSGLTNSISVPANLSSSHGCGNGWSHLSSNNSSHLQPVPNPFSMFGTSPTGHSHNNGTNTNGWGPSNPHNPFASSSAPSWPSNSPFGASHGHNQGAHHGHDTSNQQPFHFGGSSSTNKSIFNPFSAPAATTAPTNPHNPFL